MKSWKARLLILATMLAMLIALATPAMAEHEADLFEEALDECADVYEDLGIDDPDLFWQCVEEYVDYYDHDDEDDEDDEDGDEDNDGIPDWLDDRDDDD